MAMMMMTSNHMVCQHNGGRCKRDHACEEQSHFGHRMMMIMMMVMMISNNTML